MKKSILIFMSLLFSYSAQASNVPPVSGITSTPNQSWFYNLDNIVLSASPSYDTDGYIVQSKWYINGVLQASGAYESTFSTCFALHGSPDNDCYELASGVTNVTVGLEVQDNQGEWSTMATKIYTIQEHKGRKYFVKDHLGNVRTTVNRDGNVLGHDDYYPFGLTMPGRSSNQANPNDNYKFTGHERDDEAGLTLDYMMARNYDPIIGRFLQIDPLADQFPGWTPYHYVHNNPLNLIDPTGMAAMDTWQFNVDTQEVERIDDKGGDEVQYINYVNSEGEALQTSKVTGSEVYIGKADSKLGYIAAGVDLWAGLPEGYSDVSGYEYDAADLKMRYKILNGGSGDLKTALKSSESSGAAGPLTAQNYVNKYGQDAGMLLIAGQFIDMMGVNPGKGITTHSSSSRTLRTARTRSVTGNNTVTVSGEAKTVRVGPRGGRYYINRNGNKTYLKSSDKGN